MSSIADENTDSDGDLRKHSQELLLNRLVDQINEARERQATYVLVNGIDDEESVVPRVNHWHILFGEAFLAPHANQEASIGPSDDLLFFVNSKSGADGKFTYVVTVAVCTRTGPQELQILRKFSQTVYASPSRRQMDGKGSHEELVYPNLCFCLDNYEEAFVDCVLRDSESLCVELTAYSLSGRLQGVCFLGTMQYSSLKTYYDAKNGCSTRPDPSSFLGRQFGGSMSNEAPQRSVLTAGSLAPTKFMRMLGPQSKGLVEFALRLADADADCPCMFGGVNLISRCCTCRSNPSPHKEMYRMHRMPSTTAIADRVTPTHAITSQPTKLTEDSSGHCLSKESFADWVGLSVPPIEVSGLANIQLNSLSQLYSIPKSAKSADASAATSPVHRWGRSGFATPGWSRFQSNRASLRPRRSQVSSILSRFTGGGGGEAGEGTTERNMAPDEVKTNNVIEEDVLSNNAVAGADGPRLMSSSKQIRDNVLFDGPDRPKRSFGQSWSWFKERRRITSVGLHASLTFLCVPCSAVLSDLISVRREPILNITG